MRRFLTLVLLLCLAIPAGISISGCYRNPAGNYCNGEGYGLKDDDVASVTLQPQTAGISLAFGQTKQLGSPAAYTCKGGGAVVNTTQYTYGTSNNQLVDISPTGNICAGTWNRNSGGGIPNYTICNFPNPLPATNGLPYQTAFVTASISSVTSNPVEVYIHQQVTSVSLVGPQQCLSQTATAQLDSQACFSSGGQQYLLCAPSSVTSASSPSLACPLAPGSALASIPSCGNSIGTFNYAVASSNIATINTDTNQITANLPGTTAITASIAGSGSSAGYFSTCPPKSINITLANGKTTGSVTLGVQQNLTTTVTDTNGNSITGLALDYQSTNPIDITTASAGTIYAAYPGVASITAVCQPASCNPSPINELGLNGTGLSITSNPVTISTPGTDSEYVWFGAPGQSQYFAPVEVLSGTVGSTVRLPYVPNSMVMDQLGENLYFGSARELMIYSATSNSISKQDPNAPGVVLAVSPGNSELLINDQVRQIFYLYGAQGGSSTTYGGLGTAAAWTPDSKTLYITDTTAANVNGVTGHTNTLYVYNVNTGWSTYDLSSSGGAEGVAITIPGIGAYLAGYPTVAHAWCPSGTVGGNTTLSFYPQSDSVNAQTSVLASTNDGSHILGAAILGGGITLSDIGVQIPTSVTSPSGDCPVTTTGSGATQTQTLSPLAMTHTLNQLALLGVNATAVNQVVTGSLPLPPSSLSTAQNIAFITYNGTTTGAQLPYYLPAAGGAAGKLSYLALKNSASITAPLAGAFSPDNNYFFVSTAGDNQIHYITLPTSATGVPVDSQQISPALPACTPNALDPGCTYTGSGTVVPATVITVKPRPLT